MILIYNPGYILILASKCDMSEIVIKILYVQLLLELFPVSTEGNFESTTLQTLTCTTIVWCCDSVGSRMIRINVAMAIAG